MAITSRLRATPGKAFVYYLGAAWSKGGDFPNAQAWEAYVKALRRGAAGAGTCVALTGEPHAIRGIMVAAALAAMAGVANAVDAFDALRGAGRCSWLAHPRWIATILT
jgi:hypothetical protein